MTPLILASQSPRRHDLLALLGVPFTVQPAHVDESVLPGEAPLDYVRRVARAKAEAVGQQNSGACVLAADTPVICNGEILQNPVDAADAAAMLRRESGQTVQVPTVVVVRTPNGEMFEEVVEATVTFAVLTEAEIAAYVTHEEQWRGISGAFKVQGMGAAFITDTHGTASGIMGLPLHCTLKLLRQAGYKILGH